jgi:4-aminobutyrate aminotransferase
MSSSRKKSVRSKAIAESPLHERPGPTTTALLNRDRKAFGKTFRFRASPIMVERQLGCSIWDTDGNEYLDFSAGGTVANTGYCHPKVVEAAITELRKFTHGLTPLFPSQPAIELAEKLKEITPGRFEKGVWMGASGSDAAETVYDFLPAASGRRKIITFFGSHHGLTAGAHMLSGHIASARFLQSPIVTKVPYPYCYRCPFKKGEACCNYPIDFLEREVFANVCPPEDTSCIMLEPMEGYAGEVIPPDDFIPQLREICDKHGIALVDDEVKIGLGRTGKMLGIDHSGVTPDVVIFGKPIASGLPLSAVVGRRQIMDAEANLHLNSVSGHPVCCGAAIATIDVTQKEHLAENSARMGARMKEGFERMMSRHPLIGDVRGKGLFIGIELVKDKKTKEPAKKEAGKMVYRAWQRGLIFINDGTYWSNLEITPPLIITKEQVDRGLEIFEETLTDVEGGKVPDSVLDERTWF